jgi:hypothetical protein
MKNYIRWEFICDKKCDENYAYPVPMNPFVTIDNKRAFYLPHFNKSYKIELITINGLVANNDQFEIKDSHLFWTPEGLIQKGEIVQIIAEEI